MPTPTFGTPARKALYLATSDPLRIDSEGEALVLRRRAVAATRHPFARIDRIVCNRHADWSGEALARCLQHGIPVTWVDGHGQLVGSAAPRLAPRHPFEILLHTYLDRPDWPARYANWLRCRRMDILVVVALRAARRNHPLAQHEFDEYKRDYVYNQHLEAVLPPIVRGWCHAFVTRRLTDLGLPGRHWGYDGQPLELADDLTGLLWAELTLECATLAAAADAPRAHALIVESWLACHPTRLPDHLARLKRHLARENAQWP